MSEKVFSSQPGDKPEVVARARFVRVGEKWRLRLIDGDARVLAAICSGDADAWCDRLGGDTPVTAMVGFMMVQARPPGYELEPKGLLSDPLLVIRRIPTRHVVAGFVYPFDALGGLYAGHWGLTDLYPEHRAALEAALASGRAFDTREFGAKKEI